jgi:hypothetical protein
LRGLRGWCLRAVVEQAVERRFARARGTLRRVCLVRRRRLIGAGSGFGRNLGHGNLRISGVQSAIVRPVVISIKIIFYQWLI